jgi:hypothetical protein
MGKAKRAKTESELPYLAGATFLVETAIKRNDAGLLGNALFSVHSVPIFIKKVDSIPKLLYLDGQQGRSSKWKFSKYDAEGRVIIKAPNGEEEYAYYEEISEKHRYFFHLRKSIVNSSIVRNMGIYLHTSKLRGYAPLEQEVCVLKVMCPDELYSCLQQTLMPGKHHLLPVFFLGKEIIQALEKCKEFSIEKTLDTLFENNRIGDYLSIINNTVLFKHCGVEKYNLLLAKLLDYVTDDENSKYIDAALRKKGTIFIDIIQKHSMITAENKAKATLFADAQKKDLWVTRVTSKQPTTTTEPPYNI